MILHGKKILLGVTGSIAAYKACELLRVLQKRGAEVRVAMTEDAAKFVGETTFAALSGFPVYTKSSANSLKHIEYTRWADVYIVAPCTATSLARFACGLGDEPVSLCFLAGPGEKWIVPAMNSVMYKSPAVQGNLKTLRSWDIEVMEPANGYLACGEEGAGKFPEPEDIADGIEFGAHWDPGGKTLLITIGRTQEAIDPVRYISNCSSGITGAEIAKEFLRNGWNVIAVCGPMEAKLPKQCEKINVKDAESMNKAVLAKQGDVDAIIHCAAVADYRPKKTALQKIKNSREMQTLELEEAPNILRNTIKKKKQTIVSFALETENALKNAQQKFKDGGMDILVANTAENFGKDIVEYGIFTKDNSKPTFERNSKEQLAKQLFAEIDANA
ncbi:MAG: bifunctional phosphopantothenoylcysteine decarboxylase/phosphopantothenate--cysteine ligase CoaBC [Fibromonadales bacterium]|nr:bifunctional phosphopantothenoylcysteine decarboxylase/phosphopantothenate--cysteine ligase CoaBC [Fibromonadales bacterium]